MATILVVEDEPIIVELIRVTLAADSHCVLTASSAEEARHKIASEHPDLLLLDWMLPGQSGLAFAKTLRDHSATRQLPIIMVTARSAETDKVAGLETSVDDYVTKPFSPRELRARVKAVLRRHAPEQNNQVLHCGTLCLDPLAHRVTNNEKDIALGPLEFRLLHFLMARPERVFSRAQLLDAIWGQDAEIEERTVDVLVRRLRQALSEHGIEALLETVRGSGYRFRNQETGNRKQETA